MEEYNTKRKFFEFGKKVYNGLVYKGDRLLKSSDHFARYPTIKDGTVVICDGAFKNEGIRGIYMASSIRAIGADAFKGCLSLSSMVIPEGVKTLRTGTFKGCTNLGILTLPASLTTVEPRSITNKLKELHLEGSDTVFDAKTFCGKVKNLKVIVPAEAVENYRNQFDKLGLKVEVCEYVEPEIRKDDTLIVTIWFNTNPTRVHSEDYEYNFYLADNDDIEISAICGDYTFGETYKSVPAVSITEYMEANAGKDGDEENNDRKKRKKYEKLRENYESTDTSELDEVWEVLWNALDETDDEGEIDETRVIAKTLQYLTHNSDLTGFEVFHTEKGDFRMEFEIPYNEEPFDIKKLEFLSLDFANADNELGEDVIRDAFEEGKLLLNFIRYDGKLYPRYFADEGRDHCLLDFDNRVIGTIINTRKL